MVADISRYGTLFDEKYAWNFVYNAVSEGIIPKPREKLYEDMVDEGRKRKWLSRQNQNTAREMFVFNEVFFPSHYEIPGSSDLYDRGILKWPEPLNGLIEDGMFYYIFDPDLNRELKPIIITNLNSMGYSLDSSRFDHIIKIWNKKHKSQTDDDLITQIVSETHFLVSSLFLSYFGIPTHTDTPISVFQVSRYWRLIWPLWRNTPLPADNSLGDPPSDTSEIVGLYFDKAKIYSPSPSTIKEAIGIRHLQNIDKWRNKTREWISMLSTKDIYAKDIEEDIEEANDYILGAEKLKSTIDNLALVIGIAAGIGALTAPAFAPLGTLIALGAGAAQLYGTAAAAAVKSPNRIEYPWFMISKRR